MSAPIKKFSAGGIVVSVWENSSEKNGIEKSFNTVTIDRRYKNSEEEWKSSSSLRVNDIPKAILVLQEAFRFISLKE
ncbi:MAG: hypothetical protein AB1467_04370 [Candidatus Diapherotrites archaeon]